MVVVLLTVAVAGCGNDRVQIESDLGAATEVIQAPVALLEPFGADEYGYVNSQELTISAFLVASHDVARFGTYLEPADVASIGFVRNPVARGAMSPLVDVSDSVVVVLIPLLDPTRVNQFQLDAALIGIDGDGNLVGSDYDEATERRLQALFEWARDQGFGPAESLASAARGIVGTDATATDIEAASILADS